MLLRIAVGHLGLSAGPFPTPSENTVPNAWVYDQMFPLERVQKYIPLFGGGEKQVPEMRIPARGGSIIHPIIARGGRRNANSKRAIPLSSGFDSMAALALGQSIRNSSPLPDVCMPSPVSNNVPI